LNLFPSDNLIEIYDASHVSRLFVVGDLHGCYQEFIDKLIEIDFKFDEDLVISIGDLVDRGKNSLKCLELVNQHWFKTIRGNHEQMCLEALIAPEMKKLHYKYGGEWLYDLPDKKYKEVIATCLKLPIVLEVNFKGKKIGFIHADINFNNWDEFKNNLLKNDYYTNYDTSTLKNALWDANRIFDKKAQIVTGIDEIYLGHTVVETTVQIKNCFYIDTGIVFGRYLTIKEIKPIKAEK